MLRAATPNARVPPAYGEAPAGLVSAVDEGRGEGSTAKGMRLRRPKTAQESLGYSVGKYSFTA